jgi:hypothetical protein
MTTAEASELTSLALSSVRVRPGRGTRNIVGDDEHVAMAPNIIGLGLIVAAVILMIMGGVVLWILGVICLIGGVGALFMTWQKKRRATA